MLIAGTSELRPFKTNSQEIFLSLERHLFITISCLLESQSISLEQLSSLVIYTMLLHSFVSRKLCFGKELDNLSNKERFSFLATGCKKENIFLSVFPLRSIVHKTG